MIRAIVTVGFVGLIRPAPGTWGSLAALPLAWLVARGFGGAGLIVATLAVAALGLWATRAYLAGRAEDPSEVVIDEVAGQWVALWPVVLGALNNDVALLALWPGWVAAFLLFRLFDITKPWLVGWADRQHGAVGVMLDDLIAGVFAAIGVTLLAGLYHGLLA